MNFFKLDILDLNPVDNISYINEIKQKKSRIKVLTDHFLQLIGSFLKCSPSKRVDILFYGTSINNQRTFEPILSRTRHTFYNISNDNGFEVSQYMLWSILFIVPWFVNLLKSPRDKRQLFNRNKIKYLLTYGKYIVARNILLKYKPHVLIMANDHSNMNRCFLRNASSLGIKTIYIQHASVSNQFPLLEFDYSFLDGNVSMEAYRNTSKKGSLVIISGPCRFDYMGLYAEKKPKYIGISLNEFDDFNIVSNICLKLKSDGFTHLKVRPHPSMGLWYKEWFENNGISFSTPEIESPGVYLSSLKAQISNVSGIHLDAIMLKVPTILFQLSKQSMPDIFLFKERHIVSAAETYEQLICFLLSSDNIMPKDSDVQYFIASYNTPIEFKVGQFICECIDNIIDFNFDDEQIIGWIKHGITTYKF